MDDAQPKKDHHDGNAPAWAVTILLVAATALLVYGSFPGQGMTRLFFSNGKGSAPASERRRVPLVGTPEQKASELVEELLLGPMDRTLRPVFPYGTRLDSLIWRGSVMYVDLSGEARQPGEAGIALAVACIESTLRRTIPGIGRIRVSVAGIPVADR